MGPPSPLRGPAESFPLAVGGPLLRCNCPSGSSCCRLLPSHVFKEEEVSASAAADTGNKPQTDTETERGPCVTDCLPCKAWGAFVQGCRVHPAVLGAFLSLTFCPFKTYSRLNNTRHQQQQQQQGECRSSRPTSYPPCRIISPVASLSGSSSRSCCWLQNPYRCTIERVLFCSLRGKEGFGSLFHRLLGSHELGVRVFLSIDPRFIRGVSFAARALSLKCLSKYLLSLLYQTLIQSENSTGTGACSCCCGSGRDARQLVHVHPKEAQCDKGMPPQQQSCAKPQECSTNASSSGDSSCSSSSSSTSPCKKPCLKPSCAAATAARAAAATAAATAAAASACTVSSPLTPKKTTNTPAPTRSRQQQDRKAIPFLGCCGSRLCSSVCCCSNGGCLSLFCTPSAVWGVQAVQGALAAAAAAWGDKDPTPAAAAKVKYRWWLRDKLDNPAVVILLQRLRVLLPDVLLLRLAQLLAAAAAAVVSPAETLRDTKRRFAADLAAMVAAFPLETQQQQQQHQQQQPKQSSALTVSSDAEDPQQQQGGSSRARVIRPGTASREASIEVYEHIRTACLDFLCVLLHLSCCSTEHRRCCIVRCRDIAVAKDVLGSEKPTRFEMMLHQAATGARSGSTRGNLSSNQSSSSDGSWSPDSSSSSSSEGDEGYATEQESGIVGLRVCVAESGDTDGLGGTLGVGVYEGPEGEGKGHRIALQDYLSNVINCRCGCADADCDPDEETESEGAGDVLEDTSSSEGED